MYRHTQTGWLVLWALSVSVVILGAVGLTAGMWRFALPMAALFVTLAMLFGSLTAEVRDGFVVCTFGIGLIRRRIPLADVLRAEIVRNHWYYGWGIRWIPRGWMFNVSGFDAVELTFTNDRRFRIGTDRPQELCRAIEQARRDGRPGPGA